MPAADVAAAAITAAQAYEEERNGTMASITRLTQLYDLEKVFSSTLVLDHVDDDGAADKKIGLTGGFKTYAALRRAGWPKDRHRLLCHNCNFRKEYRRRKNAVKIASPGSYNGSKCS